MIARFSATISLVAAATFVLAQGATPSDKLSIKRTLKSDASTTYKVATKVDVGGQDIEVTLTMNIKATGAKKEGVMGAKAIFSDLKMIMGGQESPQGHQEMPEATFSVKNDGSFFDVTSEGDGPEAAFPRFVLGMMSVPLPDKAAPGDKFKAEWPKDALSPLGSATEEFLVVGIDAENPAKALKVKVTMKGSANSDAGAFTATGFVWIDTKSGEVVSMKGNFTDLNIQQTVSGTVSVERK